jgi:hypothetical protein
MEQISTKFFLDLLHTNFCVSLLSRVCEQRLQSHANLGDTLMQQVASMGVDAASRSGILVIGNSGPRYRGWGVTAMPSARDLKFDKRIKKSTCSSRQNEASNTKSFIRLSIFFIIVWWWRTLEKRPKLHDNYSTLECCHLRASIPD